MNTRFGRRRNNRQQQQQRRSSFVLDRHYFVIQITLVLVTIFCILAWFWIHIATGLRRGDSVDDWSGGRLSSSSVEVVDEDHHSSFADVTAGPEKDVTTIVQEPYETNLRIDAVVAFLMNLAELPPQQLWDTFGMDDDKNDGSNGKKSYGKDPFSLEELEQGHCPSGLNTAEWLPPRPWNSEELSSMFQSKAEELKTDKEARNEETVLIWYEHISKAGGTTFCGLAKTNLGQSLVPKYFCMPKRLDSDLADGRVGSWTNEELIGYTKRESHLLVANEWDPFSHDKLKLSGRTLDGKKFPLDPQHTSPQLLFVTTLRDPLDRLLSAYLFFGAGESPSDFGVWIRRNIGRLPKYRIGEKGAFRCNIARYNVIVWRYSGGNLEHPVSGPSSQQQETQFPLPMTDGEIWRDPFESAIRALSQQDLILPMDIMSKEEGQEAMRRLLGWGKVAIKEGRGKGDRESGHIVTTGKIQNSNAREYLNEEEYRFLWDANWLDNILVLWCRAVFLARLHCNDI
ncbi:hypothetical protein QTG54_009102 [Skeletonema marinoi]|uniref:Sulfotransferase domain-containing protein n=1 Tax=Skeletonema marinoi TaxID=267567 RepID=A0AAD8Y6X2_9STRA|nr:hypothetical protein QTG54_009102 [Skeletonema marinoi]